MLKNRRLITASVLEIFKKYSRSSYFGGDIKKQYRAIILIEVKLEYPL